MDDNVTLQGLASTWALDREARMRPDKLTAWFHSSVPVLQYLNWTVTDTERGFAETVLPLNVNSTNQNITHQGGVMLIAADYTGGIALATLLNGVPVVGLHPQPTDYAAYLWGAKVDSRWISPSCDDLVCTARIPEAKHVPIARRFLRGNRILATVHIDMRNNGELVAEADISYWVEDTYALRKNAFDEEKIHVLYSHRHKTSAQLVAGLRALEQDRPTGERLFHDPVVESLAGKHGRILAERFCLIAPQLQPMIATRTRFLDHAISQFHQGRACQIVNIGVGMDTSLYRASLAPGTSVFELDLPIMLRRRSELLKSLPVSLNVQRIEVPVDLRVHDVADELAKIGVFDPSASTFVVWEGGSMYFDHRDTARILSSIPEC